MIKVQLGKEARKKEEEKEKRRLEREVAARNKNLAITGHSETPRPKAPRQDTSTPPQVGKVPCHASMNPIWSCEWTRNQFLARSGRRGDASVAFAFADHGGVEGAQEACANFVDAWRARL